MSSSKFGEICGAPWRHVSLPTELVEERGALGGTRGSDEESSWSRSFGWVQGRTCWEMGRVQILTLAAPVSNLWPKGLIPTCLPVLKQQCPQHIGTVLGTNLVRNYHLLYHLVSHSGHCLLIQVKKHSSCRRRGRWMEVRSQTQQLCALPCCHGPTVLCAEQPMPSNWVNWSLHP